MPQHFALPSAARFTALPVSPYHRYGWQATPSYLWYPSLLSPACAANTFASSPSTQQTSGQTLGSLVDGKSNLFKSQNYGNGLASASDRSSASANSVGWSVGFYQPGCGTPASL